jgi:PKD repeat protein
MKINLNPTFNLFQMMKTLTTVLFVLFIYQGVLSQSETKYGSPNDSTLPQWIREMYKPTPDYGKVMDLYHEYYKNHKLIKNTHTQYYKRLIHDLIQDPYGDKFGFTTHEEANKRREQYLMQTASSNQRGNRSTWSCVGPFDFDKESVSRNYASGAAHMFTVEQSISNPDVIYAGGATSGFWKSIDKGLHWTLLSGNMITNRVYSIEIDPTDENTAYFGSGNNLYKTTDGGTTISQIGDAAFRGYNHSEFREITTDPTNHLKVWSLTDAGLFLTTDGGNNWSQVMAGKFQEMEYHPTKDTIIYCVKQIDDSTEFYKSTDGGTTWAKKSNGWPSPSLEGQPAENKRVELAVSPAAPDTVYAYATGIANGGSGTYGLYISTDMGESWSFKCCGSQPAGPPDAATNPNLMGWADDGSDNGGQYYYDVGLAVSETNADSVLVGGVNLWYSTNGGVNFSCPSKWSHSYKQNYVHADIHDIKIFGKDWWLACDGGIFYTNDGGTTWNRRMFGISGTDFWGFGAGYSNGDVMIGGAYHNGSLMKDGDVYQNGWVSIWGGDNTRGFVNPYNDRIVYHDYGKLKLSGDRMVNYQSLTYNINPNTESNLEFDNNYSKIILSGVGTKLVKSIDGGESFIVIHDFGTTVGRVKVAPSDSSIIVVATVASYYDKKFIYRTTNGGTTWDDITPSDAVLNGKNNIPYDFEIDENHPDTIYLARVPQYAWLDYLKDGYKVFKTADGGTTWNNISTSTLDGEFITNIAYQHGTDGGVYLGTRRAVYYRNNTMPDWVLYNTGLPPETYSQTINMDYYNNRLIMGSNHSVYVNDFYEPSTVEADFVADKKTVFCSRDTIYFVDHSTIQKTGTSWLWSFPNASFVSSLSDQNPKVVYNTPGTYSVSLTVTDATNNTASSTKNSFVIIGTDCEPDSLPGNALEVSGSSNDYAVVPPMNLNSNTITITAWVKRYGDQNDYAGIVFSRDANTTAGINVKSDNNLGYHWNGGHYSFNSGFVLPDSIWAHVALVIEPDKATIYMNGEPAVNITNHSPEEFDGELIIGGDDIWNRKFKGLIDEVCIYNESLSQDQIRDLMYKTIDPSEILSLVHYYQFNRSAGDVADRVSVLHASIKGNATRIPSTAPIPFMSLNNGVWSDTTTWRVGQAPPIKNWSRVSIEHEITLNKNQTVKSLDIKTGGKLTIDAGKQLNVEN